MAVDILVIGGGIHGVAVARDAAHRGLRVLLVEKGDLASATSSRTSKLIHGGLRYLETGQIRLVREALREREILLTTASEFVRPLPFLIPHYARRGRPRRWIALGLALYRFLGGKPHSGALAASADEALRLYPGLDPEGLLGASLFGDAQMDDARLCVALALDAERAGAVIRTHTEVVAVARAADGRGWRVHFHDRVAGADGEEETRAIVNATGPWVDEVRALVFGHPAPSVRRTRGAHVVLPAPPGAGPHALLLTARRDGRVFFVVPWGTHTLVGTTDDDDPADPGEVAPRAEDVRYLLDEAGAALSLSLAGVRPVRAFAGVRPLARGRAARPWENSREHRVLAEGGIWTIVGGKYTTHRALAERVVDQVVRGLSIRAGSCVTATLPVRSGRAVSLEKLRPDFPRAVTLTGGLAISEAEVAYAAQVEKARCLDDILLRRTRLWLDARALREGALPSAVWAAPILGWSERTRAAEVDRLLAILDREESAIVGAVGAATPIVADERRARA